MKKKTAEKLKCRIIDYLLQKHPNIIIGNEIMFGSSRNSADLLAILNNNIIAIEIKSKDDNLNRLRSQIDEYAKVFDKIIIYCSHDKIDDILKIIAEKPIGLYCISENCITKMQKAMTNNSTCKEEMLASMPASYLKKVFKLNWKLNSDETRMQLYYKSKKLIHKYLHDFYTEKITPSFKLYIRERGDISVIDDLPILSKESRIL